MIESSPDLSGKKEPHPTTSPLGGLVGGHRNRDRGHNMPRKAKELSAIEVKRLPPGNHAAGGVAGLTLQHRETGARSWLLRVRISGKRHELGLGPYPEVSLAKAREAAADLAQRVRAGQGADVLTERREFRAKVITFRHAAKEWWTVKRAEIEEKQRKRYWSLLEIHVLPVLGPKNVADVTMADCLLVLEPLWTTKTETATRARERIDAVMAFALAKGWRSSPSPAVWKGGLAAVLPAPSRVAKVRHHPALPIDDVPKWYTAVAKREGESARALQLLALLALRSGELRAMRWGWLDMGGAILTVPAEFTKTRKALRVPLAPAAVALIEGQAPEVERKAEQFVFRAPKGGMLSDMALSMQCRRLHSAAIEAGGPGWVDPKQGSLPMVPHSLRSSMRDWAAERTEHAEWVAEMALGHAVGSGVERAYRRGEVLSKRRALLEEWSEFVTGAPAAGASLVVTA